MINATGNVMENVAPEMVASLEAAGFTVVTPANSEPLPKKGLNRAQRTAVSTVNRAQSLVIPSVIADAVKAGTLSTIPAKVKDFLLKTSKSGGFYVACQVECNFDNNVITFCILDDVDNAKLDIGNLIQLELEPTENPAIRSGVIAKVEK